MHGLYAIVDIPHPHGLSAEVVTRAVLADRLEGGVDGASVVQLRAKRATTAQRIEMLTAMAEVCERAAVPLHANDDLEAALAVEGVAGVHLGQDDAGVEDIAGVRSRVAAAGRPDLRIGISTHDLRQLREAGRRGPDYLAFGPVAPTRSKERPDAVVGIDGLLDAARLTTRPLVAIGGLDLEVGARAIEVGAHACAVIGALVAPTPEAIAERARALSRAFAQAARPLSFDEVQRRLPVLDPEQLVEIARFGDDVGMHIELGLPARFRPRVVDGTPVYRSCDVLDLLYALGKRSDETWDAWRRRGADVGAPLVQLRR